MRVAPIVTLFLVLGWIVSWYGPRAVAAGQGVGESESPISGQPHLHPRGDGSTDGPDLPREAGEVRTRAGFPSSPLATLRIRVKREDGKPARGIVAWTAFESHPLTGSALAVFRGEESNGVHQAAYENEVTLEVPAGQWIWVRVSAAESPFVGWYLRVPPFGGERVETLLQSFRKRTLHVFALNPQMTGPAAGQKVGIYALDMRNPGPPIPLKRVKTDGNGYARVPGLEPGGFFVAAPGAGPEDNHPHTARLMLPPRIPAVESVCTVVAMPETRSVTLRVEADIQPDRNRGMAPKLYLKRKDDGSGRPYPLPAMLQPGKQTTVVRVPSGTYELGALPLGRLVLETNEAFLDVAAGADPVVDIKVRENEAMTSLELRGIPEDEFPVIVHPRRCDAVADEDPQLFFLGPYRWRRPEQQVPVLSFRCRLVGLARGGTYLADRELQMTRPGMVVDMQPACLVHVRWLGVEAVRSEGAVAITTSGKEQVVTRLRPELIADGAELQPALVGTAVVSKGLIEVECVRRDGGVAWRRQQEGQGQSLVISVRRVRKE